MLYHIIINVTDNLCQIQGIKGELYQKLQSEVFQADIYFNLDKQERVQEIAKLKAMGKVNHYYTGYVKFLKYHRFYNGFLPHVLEWFTEKGIIVTVRDYRKNIALFDTEFDKSLLSNAEGKKFTT